MTQIVIEGAGVRECRGFVPELATPWRADAVVSDRLRVALDMIGGPPVPGFSRDVAIIGTVSNELWCGVEAQQDLAKSAPFRNLAEGEFIKIMCVRNG